MNFNRWTLVVSVLLAGSMPIGAALAQTPLGTPTISLDANNLYWTSVEGATGYDLIRADLGALRQSGGDYTSAVRACLGDDLPALQLQQAYWGVPKVGEAFIFLVRAVTDSEAGTFDSGETGQQGSRDAEIKAAATACFEPVTPRGRISINGDGQFTSSRGVVAGTGSVNDPFVIAGWDIVCGNPANAPGIEIRNATAEFVIRDVRVRSCLDGIVLDSDRVSNVVRSRLTDDQRGIVLTNHASGANIEGNRFDAISGTAIAVLGGGGYWFRRNTITGAPVGIDLEAVQGAFIYRNNLIGNATQAIAHDGCCLHWSQPLPDGGNYWSDYSGTDLCAGTNQNFCNPASWDNDGIGDQQRLVPDTWSDLYPFMTPLSDEGDTLPPSAGITVPSQGEVSYEAPFTVRGQADDTGVGVDHVEVRHNGGAWGWANALAPWTRDITLAPGENVIEAVAIDRSGNRSPIARTTMTYNAPVVWGSSLMTSQASYPPGVAVPITLRVTNTSAWAGSLTFPDTCEASFTVANAGGTILYDQLAHDGCFTVIYSRSVPAGGSVSYSFNWMQVNDQGVPVPAGANYTIRGFSRSWASVPAQSTVVTITP
ncbi:MAG TPA: NosD domain-containing protein [Candidatus Polarisedimenticolia bacterium]|nr:NosD domain-containing protein [Candidatus Polarisedimenticolia bacterium]